MEDSRTSSRSRSCGREGPPPPLRGYGATAFACQKLAGLPSRSSPEGRAKDGGPNFRELEPEGGLAHGSRLLQANRLNRQVVDCRPAVIGDPDLAAVVEAEADLSKADYTVCEGTKVTGWPVTTIRRGEVVYGRQQITAAPAADS